MNRDSLLQALRVHVMRLRQQHLRQQQHSPIMSCTVDELVGQIEGALSTDKPDFGFADALARLQLILNGAAATARASVGGNTPTITHRRSSLTGTSGSASEIIDAEALMSRHSLKTLA